MTKFKFKLTTQVQLETLESDAKTYGELKQAIKNSPLGEKISFERQKEVRDGQEWVRTIKLIEKNTLAEYGSIDEASLPAGDSLIFFVTPVEHKGGIVAEDLVNVTYTDVENELDELGYNELRSLGSRLNKLYNTAIDLSGKREDVLSAILDWAFDYYFPGDPDEINLDNGETSKPQDIVSILDGAINLIFDAIAALEELEETEGLVDGTMTASQLHERALELQVKLNA